MKTRSKLTITYSLLFCGLCIIVFLPFYVYGKSFVWGMSAQDGLVQHLNSVIYWGQYIREFIKNLLDGHLKFPMWNMALGYGGDILAVLNYYAIGDPINLIYIFSNKYNAEYFYNFTILLRMYLAGVSFITYGFYMKKNHYGILVGSLIYVFSGIPLQAGLHHPFFLNPMIYLPLLFLGIEKIYRREQPYLFIFMITISAISNFYFFYMLTVISVLYALIRYFSYEKRREWKRFFCTLGKFSGFFALGIGIAAVIFFPVILGFLGNGRNGGNNGIKLFYSIKYYGRIITELVGYDDAGMGARLNYVPLAFLAVIILFLQKKKGTRVYKTAVLLCGVCFVFPFCGYVLHGFSYPSNRWSFAAAFVVSIVVTEVYPDLFSLTKKQKIGICTGTCGYILFCIFIKIFQKETVLHGWRAACFVLIGFSAGILLLNIFWISERSRLGHICIVIMVCFSIVVTGRYMYSPRKSGALKNYFNRGETYKVLCSSEIQLLKSVKDSSFYRSEAGSSRYYNFGLIDNIPNTTNYFSITDKNVSETIRGFENIGFKYLFKFQKLDGREGLLGLFSVKYRTLAKSTDRKSKMPKGFEPIAENKKYRLYKNKNVLPFGYTYDSYVTEEEYEKLNAVEKEQALLKYAVLEQKDDQVKRVKAEISVSKKAISLPKKVVNVTKGYPQHYRFTIPIDDKKENYLRLEGMEFMQTPEKGAKLMKSTIPNSEIISLYSGERKYNLRIQQNESIYYFGEHNYSIKLQTKKGEKQKRFDLILKKPGIYTFKGITCVQLDSKEMIDDLQKRKQSECLQNIKYDNGNHFSGEITNRGNRILCIPIPYSRGWKALDNGKPVQIQKVNGMFIGISLKKGQHNIQLDYVTPGIKEGAVITLISLCILGVMIIKRKRNERILKYFN